VTFSRGDVDVEEDTPGLAGIPQVSETNVRPFVPFYQRSLMLLKRGHEDTESPHPFVGSKVAAGRSRVTESSMLLCSVHAQRPRPILSTQMSAYQKRQR